MIEDASTGTALSQELKKIYFDGKRGGSLPIERDKTGRLYVHQAEIRGWSRALPEDRAHFLPELEAELLTFPQGKNDDQVDSLSQALSYTPGYNLDALAS